MIFKFQNYGDQMKKALVDCSRIMGYCEGYRGLHGIVEYGHRDNNGKLHVVGMAQIKNFSEISKSEYDFENLHEYSL